MRPLPLIAAALPLVAAPFLLTASRTAPLHADREAPPPACAPAAAVGTSRFVPNLGQWHESVRFAVLGDTVGWLHDDGFTLRLERRPVRSPSGSPESAPRSHGAVVRTRFAGAARECVAHGDLPGRHHFLVGPVERHRTGVAASRSVRLVDVHPGIDVVFGPLRESGCGPFAYDLELRPGADLAQFVATCDGVESLAIDAEGGLCLTLPTPEGPVELRHSAPIAWQDGPAGRRPLAVRFQLRGERAYGFVAPDLDPAAPATIDPGIVWSTLLGGGGTDSINDFVWRPGSGIWVAGWSGSLDFPTTAGAYQSSGGRDGFVARLSEDGSQIAYATYYGGSDNEEIRGLDLGPGETPTFAGFTHSANLPLTAGAVQPFYAGASFVLEVGDGFVARLSATGDQLLASTYLGGVLDDAIEDVVVDAAGDAYVAGWTSSPNFPTTAGAWRPSFIGPLNLQTDGFVACVAADGRSLRYSTYAGGSAPDQLRAIDLDPATGEVVAAGWASSADFPTTPTAYRTTSGGVVDMVALRLRANGSQAVFSTYLGGVDSDVAETVLLGADGSCWLGGFTRSPNFPTSAGAPQRTPGGLDDGAIVRLAANGQSLVFSTLLGGGGADIVRGLAVDGSDLVAVGETTGAFPVVPGALQATYGGGGLDAFFAHYTGLGAVLDHATYFGGQAQDVLARAALDSGLCVLSGWTFSADHPVTAGALQTQLRGVEDGVLMQVDLIGDLGDGLEIVPVAGPEPVRFVGAETAELLAVRARNRTGRDLWIDRVRVLIAGSGSGPSHLRDVAVHVDDPLTVDPYDQRVAGPLAVVGEDRELEIALGSVRVPRLGETLLRVAARIEPAANGATIEAACATVDASAWSVRAYGAGAGPQVRVFGDGRAVGAVLVAGALPGDRDGDGVRTVFDLRRQAANLGADAGPGDCDGDGVVTVVDLELTQHALLGRATAVVVPLAVVRGEWFTLRGVFPAGSAVDGTLGSRTLTPGRVTPREVTLRVDAAQPPGLQTLQVSIGGQLLAARDVLVQ